MAMPLAVMKYLHYGIVLIAKVIWKKNCSWTEYLQFYCEMNFKTIGKYIRSFWYQYWFWKGSFFYFHYAFVLFYPKWNFSMVCILPSKREFGIIWLQGILIVLDWIWVVTYVVRSSHPCKIVNRLDSIWCSNSF